MAFDHPVHQQVWVAANRAGEVGVGLKCQAEMAAVDGRVNGLAASSAAAWCEFAARQAALWSPRQWPGIQGLGLSLIDMPTAMALRYPRRMSCFSGVGPRAHGNKPGLAALLNEVRAADVGRQHRLFDQLVRVVARAARSSMRPFRRRRSGLSGGFEIHRTTLPGATSNARYTSSCRLSRSRTRSLRLLASGPRVRQDGCHLGIVNSRGCTSRRDRTGTRAPPPLAVTSMSHTMHRRSTSG